MEIRIQDVVGYYDHIEFVLRRTRKFRTYIGPGSDGLSADKLSLDLKFNPWDIAITCQPDCRSMSKSVFTQYDPLESWYTEQSDVFLNDVKNVLPPTNAPCDRCSSVFSCTAEHRFDGGMRCIIPLVQRRVRDVEQGTEERNI